MTVIARSEREGRKLPACTAPLSRSPCGMSWWLSTQRARGCLLSLRVLGGPRGVTCYGMVGWESFYSLPMI
jgi:hypothetical protein